MAAEASLSATCGSSLGMWTSLAPVLPEYRIPHRLSIRYRVTETTSYALTAAAGVGAVAAFF
jgi:hypothetical protein